MKGTKVNISDPSSSCTVRLRVINQWP
jgi:hypothetical protein